MNTRHCVHFASQGSVGSDSLALLRLSNNELTSISTYYRLAVNNGVVCWFVLGHQQPDYYTRKGRAVHREEHDGFGKRVAVGTHFYQLRVDEASLPAEDGIPPAVEVGIKMKKKDSMSD